MGNMEQYKQNSERTQSPTDDDDEDDDAHHEQLRLVETPDPIIFSRMESGKSNVNGLLRDASPDSNHPKNYTSVQCQNEFYSHYICPKEESSMTDVWPRLWKKCRSIKCSPVKWVVSLIPILSWLPKYSWKTDLVFDPTAGLTVAVMNIPQGMAYALLCNVEPIVGLYMGFFPVILYAMLGTSRHVSIGTFAVICLMSGKMASEKAAYYAERNANSTTNDSVEQVNYSMLEINTALSLCVGVWQLIMGVFQLGSLSVLLSAELISGFATGCAVHVLTSQMKNLFGLSTARRTGVFKIPLTYADIVLTITKEANTTAVLLSLVTITFLVTYNEFIKPTLSKRLSFPIPIELVTIIIGTLVSRYWITSSAYGIAIVDKIPTGKESRVNGSIWLTSFLATVLLDIEYGLFIGVIITISSLLWKSSSIDVVEMGQHVHSHLFVERKEPDTSIIEVSHMKILKLVGNLNFVTSEVCITKTGNILNKSQVYLQRNSSGKIVSRKGLYASTLDHTVKSTISTLILDFSSVSSIDPAAVKSIIEFHDNQKKEGVQIFYAACASNVIAVMSKCKLFNAIEIQYFYPSIEHVLSDIPASSPNSIEKSDHHDEQTVITQTNDHFNEYYLG